MSTLAAAAAVIGSPWNLSCGTARERASARRACLAALAFRFFAASFSFCSARQFAIALSWLIRAHCKHPDKGWVLEGPHIQTGGSEVWPQYAILTHLYVISPIE